MADYSNSVTLKASVFVKASTKWLTIAKVLAYCIKIFIPAVKTYYGRNLRIFVIVPDKPFQASPMFEGKVGAYLSEAPFRYSTLG